jgi:hypothetical protein
MKIIHLLLIALIAGTAQASALHVTLDTTLLGFSPPGPLSLAFQLADGSGTGDGNNSVTLSNFSGFTPAGVPILVGSASGDLSSFITITDATPANIFIQGATFGSVLTFNLLLTTNVDPGTPDEFLFSILDSTFSPLPTFSTSPLFPLLVVDIDSASPTVATFGSDQSQQPVAGGTAAFPAPQVSVISSVPEPSSIALCIVPLALMVLAFRQKIRTRA